MLFGKDTVIANVNPYCRTDALYRVDDLERYDDRDFVETNLLDMYERLIDFVTKYTMDRFALDEKSIRTSPRNIMAREMIINMIMHRDITDGHTSRIIVYKDKIVCENPNSFGTMSEISIKNYTPFTKNPTLAKFFREIGYADELGSGVIRITKNSLLYSGKLPAFEDKEMFRLTIPLLRDEKLDENDLLDLAKNILSEPINELISGPINGPIKLVFSSIEKKNNATQKELAKMANLSIATVKRILAMLKGNNYIERIGSNKNGYWRILKTNELISEPINELISGPINDPIKLVLSSIEKKNNATQKELAKMANLSIATVKRILAMLKGNNYIERIGSNKNGYWRILKTNELISEPINEPISGPINDPIKLVLSSIEKKNNATQKELAKMTNLSIATVKRILAMLKSNNHIERIGSNKNGYWRILKTN